MKKRICWLVLLGLLLAPGMAEGGAAHTIVERTMDFYFCDLDTVSPRSVYFIDGSDVPCLALSDWPGILDQLTEAVGAADPVFPEISFQMAGNVATLRNGDGYDATFDCDADVIRFLDFNAFMRANGDALLMDVLDEGGAPAPDGSVRYFRRDRNSYERYGREVKIDAGAYDIDLVAGDGECYVPIQTLSDCFLSHYYYSAFYNGEAVFLMHYMGMGSADALSPVGEKYYSVKPHERSERLARFAYNEFCMVMDTLYGLKGNHDIQSFDALADETGLKPALTGTDPAEADRALFLLLHHHLDDLHTYYRLPSPLSGIGTSDSFMEELGRGQSSVEFRREIRRFNDARAKVYPDDVPGYEEVGNTAFITFDHFVGLPEGVDYYKTPPTAEAEDTIGLLIYAYGQITRPDSPVENVVLDLSCDMGGESVAAVFTLGAFLGTGSVSAKDPLTGAMVTGNYEIDINLDGVIDEKDLGLLDKNLFCLESPVSFSCANLVTCAFKHSNRVSLIGKSSGGGACIVYPLTTADGSYFQISGDLQLSFLKNGAFYDIDQGAEPDYPLMKPDAFYDRKGLVAFINGLM